MIGNEKSNSILFDYKMDGLWPELTQLAESMATEDSARVNRLKTRFEEACAPYGLPPALLAGLASRTTRCGAFLHPNGWLYDKRAYGVCAIPARWHTPVHGSRPDSEIHITQACELLAGLLERVSRKYHGWPDYRQLLAAVSAYESGFTCMPEPPETCEFANDVWTRALYYAR